MRIVLISQEYPPETSKGGIGSQTYIKAHGLTRLGHEVHVISRSVDLKRHVYRDGSVLVTRIPGINEAAYTDIADWVSYSSMVAAELMQQHHETPFDIADFPEWGCEGFVHLLNQSEWNRLPTVIHLHGPLVMLAHTLLWPELTSKLYKVGSQLEETTLHLADAVYSSSECSADWCTQHYGLERQEIPCLHTGVNIELFYPRDIEKNARTTVIFVGKIVENKGIVLLLEAVCRLANEYPDLKLEIVGRGEDKIIEKLHKIALHYKCPDIFELAGFVEKEDLPTYLSRAHLFAAPSRFEGGPGFVYLEAMACGLPVIGCSGSGATEIVNDGDTGLLIPPDDINALTNALAKLLADPVKREVMGKRALAYVREHSDSKQCVQSIADYYQSVIKKCRKPLPGGVKDSHG